MQAAGTRIMELICPVCLGTLETTDGKTARCTIHGGEFQILFLQWTAPAPPVISQSEWSRDAAPPLVPPPVPGLTCYQHPALAAMFACRTCGKMLCQLCAFADEDGNRFCPECAPKTYTMAGAPPPIPMIPAGMKCVRHPSVDAIRQCKTCGSYMCETCDFALPGNIHICPTCAAAPKKMSRRRKKFLIGSFVLATWCTIMF